MCKPIRCKACNKLLAKGSYISLEIKCRHCKTINKLEHPRVPIATGENTREGVQQEQYKTTQYRLPKTT